MGSRDLVFIGLRANNSLKLTRRARSQFMLAWPASLPHNPCESACFRRAA
jgi:hypothetical protein